MATIAAITNDELVVVQTWSDTTTFHLKPLALARVFRLLEVPRRRLDVTLTERGDLHINFAFRGFGWTAVVLAKEIGCWEEISGFTFCPHLAYNLARLELAKR